MKIQNPEVQRILVVSSAHIHPNDDFLLTHAETEVTGVVTDVLRYGHLILVPETLPEIKDMSREFVNLMYLARKMKFDFVRIDRDGPMYDELTVIEWPS